MYKTMRSLKRFVCVEGFSQGCFRIFKTQPVTSTDTRSSFIPYMSQVQNWSIETARNFECLAKGYSIKHLTPPVFPYSSECSSFPGGVTWFPFPTGTSFFPSPTPISMLLWHKSQHSQGFHCLTFFLNEGSWNRSRVFSSQGRSYFTEWGSNRYVHNGLRGSGKLVNRLDMLFETKTTSLYILNKEIIFGDRNWY